MDGADNTCWSRGGVVAVQGSVVVVHGINRFKYRYTFDPNNEVSEVLVRNVGSAHAGLQFDEEDGPEDIYEMSVKQYLINSLVIALNNSDKRMN